MAVTLEKVGGRVYFVGNTFAVKDQIKSMGGHWDKDRGQWWVGTAKADAADALVGRLNAASVAVQEQGPGVDRPTGTPTASEPDSARVYAKVTYRGRNYFVVGESHANNRCRICPLSGTGFWVGMADCELVKTYAPREYRGRTEYTTLGSIRRFVESQRAAESQGLPQCAACGKRGQLHHDLEDGLDKCYGCCDMPE